MGDPGIKDVFFEIRQFRLLESPIWDDDKKLWTADAVFYPADVQTHFPVKFSTELVPACGEGDIIYAVNRSGKFGWVALMPDPVPRVGRILAHANYGATNAPNKWTYLVQQLGFDSILGNGSVPTLNNEARHTAINLCEIENSETGMMGNGINLNGFAPSGTPHSYLAPVPNGTLVFMFSFSWAEETGVPLQYERRNFFVFQFPNQLMFPFCSHLYEETPDSLTGPSESGQTPDNNHLTMSINGEDQKVYCPLLRSGETIPAHTKVILSQNIKTGFWEIIETRCASASAAPQPNEGEDEGADPEFQNDPVGTDDPENEE